MFLRLDWLKSLLKLFCFTFHSGPTALVSHGIGVGKTVTSYPSVKDKFKGKVLFVAVDLPLFLV